MVDDKLTKLGARLLGSRVANVELALGSLRGPASRSKCLRHVLVAVGGAVVFENGAKFRSDEPTPLSDKRGWLSLEVLFGVGGKDGLEDQTARYRGELPEGSMPIGESAGGNIVFLDESGKVYFWDHESENGQGIWRVADSFDEFFDRLCPDDSELGSTDGIIESESHLDF